MLGREDPGHNEIPDHPFNDQHPGSYFDDLALKKMLDPNTSTDNLTMLYFCRVNCHKGVCSRCFDGIKNSSAVAGFINKTTNGKYSARLPGEKDDRKNNYYDFPSKNHIRIDYVYLSPKMATGLKKSDKKLRFYINELLTVEKANISVSGKPLQDEIVIKTKYYDIQISEFGLNINGDKLNQSLSQCSGYHVFETDGDSSSYGVFIHKFYQGINIFFLS
ncbi:hypothetical protein RF11_10526 [Thelohanellus kitauei]|uniref:Uncharacterized protein n=1 Tax=Thelohanellus kitauei TaxID=669202 RepID=A0A0C2IV18_THEKT|nr:hypothetical protein RF11_10526 [Thelohanellus kitauei]